MLPLRTGNLSVAQLRAAWHGAPLPGAHDERRALAGWRAQGFDAVEDYVSWAVVEPRPGAWDFSWHREQARAARAAGLAYWVYLWLHVSPPWWRRPGSDTGAVPEAEAFVPMRCLEHGCTSRFPSLHAPGTDWALQRFYRAAGEQLGELVDGVVVGFPADYGEVGYPSGVADWILEPDGAAPDAAATAAAVPDAAATAAGVPDAVAVPAAAAPPARVAAPDGASPPDEAASPAGVPHHTGFWCAEAPARAAFAAAQAAHGDGPALAVRWNLDAVPDGGAPYPHFGGAHEVDPRHRRDFVDFYRGAVSAWTDRALGLAAAAFPGRPLEFKLGHCSESVHLGRDLGALVGIARTHGATIRSTQSGMEELFTARLASLCRTGNVRLGTEAPRELGAAALSRRVFVDAAQGCRDYFEYPEQHADSAAGLDGLDGAWGRARRPSPLAVLHPTQCLVEQPGLGVWDGLAASWPALARLAPLEVYDEAQLSAGALSSCAALLVTASTCGVAGARSSWPEGAAARAQLDDWLAAGGVLVHAGAWPAVGTGWPRYRLDGALPDTLAPGCPSAAPWLGPGWTHREDGAFAWGPEASGDDESLPTRWTDGRALLLLPRPRPGGQLRLSGRPPPRGLVLTWRLYVPAASAPAAIAVHGADGRVLSSVRVPGHGVCEFTQVLPSCGDDDVLRCVVRSGTHRSEHALDRRALGVLVRDVRVAVLGARAAKGRAAASAPPTEPRGPNDASAAADAAERLASAAGVTWQARAGWAPHGRGGVLSGEGSNLFVLAALRAWLAGDWSDVAPPALVRDLHEGCQLALLEGGLLAHNPDGRHARRPRLSGPGAPRDPGEIPPLATRWYPGPST